MNKKVSTPIAISIIVLCAFLAGLILIGKYGFFPEKETHLSKPSEKTEEVVTEDETTDWKTYRNEEYGFEIKYPKDWKERKVHLGGVELGIFNELYYYSLLIRWVDNPNRLKSKEYSKWWLEKFREASPPFPISYKDEREVLAGECLGYEFYGLSGGFDSASTNEIIFLAWSDEEIAFQIEFPTYEFQTNPNIINPKENYRLAHLMLSTFRFLE